VRILKEPFVQFLLVGTLIFVAYHFSRTAEEVASVRRIVLDAPTQEWIHSNFAKQFRRPPSRQEMGGLIRAHIEHEIKYREALTMGLDDRDSIVRRRMMQKFDFLFGNAAADAMPDEEILSEWYETHWEEFAEPPTISFAHVWFSPDSRGDRTQPDAAAALVALRAGEAVEGDRFPFEVAFELSTPAEVRNVFGEEFGDAIFSAPVNEWSGPFASGLGVHVARVSARVEGKLPPLEEVRDAVLAAWREAESDRIIEELVAELRADYEIEIDEAALVSLNYVPGSAENAE
jgi:hypothetical protein